MKTPAIKLLDHFRALRFATDGFSVSDISRETGVCLTAIRRVIKNMIGEGKAEMSGFRQDRMMDGRSCRVPLYRLIEPKVKRGCRK
jgi:hypothetical protein